MIILDFLFYYLALYFSNRPKTLSWSNPVQRASCCLGLMSTSWVIAILFFILIHVVKNYNFNSNYMILLVPIALILIWFYGYVYDTKGRYYSVSNSNSQILKINENLGMSIAWLVLLISFASPFIILLLDMK